MKPGVGGLVGDLVGVWCGRVVDLTQRRVRLFSFSSFSLDRPEYVRAGGCMLTLLS